MPRRVAEFAAPHYLPEAKAKASCQLTLARWTRVRARGRPNVRLGSASSPGNQAKEELAQ
jgi:hypothetical protein